MLKGIAREGKTVLRAQIVARGDTITRAIRKIAKRIIEEGFIV
jgi:hypothetical protein